MSGERSTLIVGSRGNLALKLREKFPKAKIISRLQFLSWESQREIRRDLPRSQFDIFLAVGITSGKANPKELSKVNFEIPAQVAQAIVGSESRIVTFGSIMEKEPKIIYENPYIYTKSSLSEFLSKRLNTEQFLHLRLHTLYGGCSLNREMFLGQLFYAIKEKTNFQMTSGEQLREYHHIDDDLSAMDTLIARGHFGIQEITHGDSFRLREIAEKVLSYFQVPELLQLGKLNNPYSEILKPIGKRSEVFNLIEFRPTIQGICNYFEEKFLESSQK